MDSQDVLLGHYAKGALRINYEARPPEFEGPQRACHPQATEICFTLGGEERACIGSQIRGQRTGQFGIVPAGVEHSSWALSKGTTECNIHLPTVMLERAFDDLGLAAPDELPWGPFETPREVFHLVKTITTSLQNRTLPAHDLLLDSLCTSLSLWLAGELICAPRNRPKSEGERERRALQRVEELLVTCPEDDYSIDELANMARMGRFRFLRAFKKQYGISPYAYLLKVRVERGAELVENTEHSLTRIAFDLGFGSSGRFSEAFKRHYGHSPSVHRRSSRTKRKITSTICEASTSACR